MDIPQTWKEIPEDDGTGYFQSFIEADTVGIPIKKLCLDSVSYRLRHFPTDIPQALEEMGFHTSGSNIFRYVLNNYIHIVVGFEMNANNYKGLYCSFKAKLPCEVKKTKKENAKMQYLLFSNGAETICLINNGIPLTESALLKIEQTFKFN